MTASCRALNEAEWSELTRLGFASALAHDSSDRTTRNYFTLDANPGELPGLGGLVLEKEGRVVSTLLFFEQSASLLDISFGVIFFLSASAQSWKSIFRDYSAGLLNVLKLRNWAFVRTALPASDQGEMIAYPRDAEIWFEISKKLIAEGSTPHDKVRVRLAGPADTKTVTRMLNRSVFAGLNRFERRELRRIGQPARQELHRTVSGTRPLVLIAEAERPVGCLFGDLQSTSSHDGMCRARIIDAYVVKERLGQGVAAILTQTFQQLCYERNIHEVAGTVKGPDIASTRNILRRLRKSNWRVDTIMMDFHPGP